MLKKTLAQKYSSDTFILNLNNFGEIKLLMTNLDEHLANKYFKQIIEIQNICHPNSNKLTFEKLFDRNLILAGQWQHSKIALFNDQVIGYAINYEREANIYPDIKLSGRNLYLNKIDVTPKFHNLGIGTGLIYRSIFDFKNREFFYYNDQKKLFVTIQTRQDNLIMKHIIENTFKFRVLGKKYYNSIKTDNVYELFI